MAQGRVDRFEDLIAWRLARELNRRVYRVSSRRGFDRDYGFRSQIRRASVSIMANLAEGFERGGPAEFHRFIVIAKGSCAELRSHLYVALDAGYIQQGEFDESIELAERLGQVIGKLRQAVGRRRRHQG